ncbi:hypothetical protein D6D10_06456 [Aureobasidium pullulans]|uniref:CHCH domain-containing protein n=1 Tax=Aureobasidium pullulans TaxID=5580 RepID=A0A4S9EQH7_AURPU|nr:hypothetical protein D6D10_06456 [Aureobasidium pullulans]
MIGTSVSSALDVPRTVENTRLNDCFFEKKDWRQCKSEMEEFKQCWKKQGNDRRTDQKNV